MDAVRGRGNSAVKKDLPGFFKKCFMIVMLIMLCLGGFSRKCAAAGSVFDQEELRLIQEQRIWKVGFVSDRKPISFAGENGELLGVSRKIFDRIMELSGLQFEYVALPAGTVTYQYLWDEGFDLITSVEFNEVNKHSRGILMSNPYLSTKKVIIGNSGLDFNVEKNLTIAVSTGSQTLKTVLKAQYPNFEIADYDSIDGCFEAVRKGEADLLILNQYVAEYWMNKPRYEEMQIIPVVGLDDALCFSAVVPILEGEESEEAKISQEEKELLVSILDKSIALLTEDETAAYIIESTMTYQYQDDFSDFMYRYRYQILLLILAAILFGVLTFLAFFFYARSMKAQAESRAKGSFLSSMSHEMRTPLNGLTGLHYIMSQNLDNKAKLVDALGQASIMTRYLLSLVTDILEMSELQENKVVLNEKAFSLRLMLEALESMESARMKEKGLHFRVEGRVSYPGLLGDEKRVEQVLLKLLDNAWKYTEPGGEVVLGVSQKEQEDGRISTRIQVRDTGRGMSREFQRRIFESFTQEKHTVSKGNQGTGLGMSISYLLAKLMDGDLQVESEPGKGSCFTFLFLARRAQEPSEPRREQAFQDEAPEKKKKVLIAEDNELNAEILRELLSEGGYEVLHAWNGREAMELFASSGEGEIGVILMDLMMPEKDGFEAARGIRGMKRPDAGTVRIFACTANTLREDRERAYECGMNDFIPKPVDMEILFRKLEEK